MDKKSYVNLSKCMSYGLRHSPESYGLTLDAEGYVTIDELVTAINAHTNFKHHNIDERDINMVVQNDKKNRFSITGNKIRANYGHSFEMRIEHQEVVPPQFLYHGTSPGSFSAICIEGIKPMARQYVHLSKDVETATTVGSRHSKHPMILVINAERAYNDGIKFYAATDNTWLADHIPAKYIERNAIRYNHE